MSTDNCCPVCGEAVDEGETRCGQCGLRFNIGTPEQALLRCIAYNTYRTRKHVVIWSITLVVIVALGVLGSVLPKL
jgi:uncharacterized membrane protein YvbJ